MTTYQCHDHYVEPIYGQKQYEYILYSVTDTMGAISKVMMETKCSQGIQFPKLDWPDPVHP